MKAYPVTTLCAVMRVSRSGFYNYLDRFKSESDHRPTETALTERIKEIFNQSRGSYGSRRLVKQLQSEGFKSVSPSLSCDVTTIKIFINSPYNYIFFYSSLLTLITSFPKFWPSRRPINACGALSKPSTICSR